jgi:hypothetical protein
MGICEKCGTHWAEPKTGGLCRLCAAVREGGPWHQALSRHWPVVFGHKPAYADCGPNRPATRGADRKAEAEAEAG